MEFRISQDPEGEESDDNEDLLVQGLPALIKQEDQDDSDTDSNDEDEDPAEEVPSPPRENIGMEDITEYDDEEANARPPSMPQSPLMGRGHMLRRKPPIYEPTTRGDKSIHNK